MIVRIDTKHKSHKQVGKYLRNFVIIVQYSKDLQMSSVHRSSREFLGNCAEKCSYSIIQRYVGYVPVQKCKTAIKSPNPIILPVIVQIFAFQRAVCLIRKIKRNKKDKRSDFCGFLILHNILMLYISLFHNRLLESSSKFVKLFSLKSPLI